MPTITWKGKPSLFTAGVNTVLVEQPNSPKYSFKNNSAVCTRRYKGLHSLCISSMPALGTVGTGDMSGWIVTGVDINREPRQIGELIVEWGVSPNGGASGTGLVLPSDEIGLMPFEINPNVERHPFFNDLTQEEREIVRGWVAAPTVAARTSEAAKIVGKPHQALAQNLAAKLFKGIETYYFAGWTYTWTTYSFSLPSTMDSGSYIDTPGGPLASLLASNTEIDWLREADSLDPGTYPYKKTKTWVGASNGHWDSDLY